MVVDTARHSSRQLGGQLGGGGGLRLRPGLSSENIAVHI